MSVAELTYGALEEECKEGGEFIGLNPEANDCTHPSIYWRR
jgi:hypothetical protein